MSLEEFNRLLKERKRWAKRWKSKEYREYNKEKCRKWYANNVEKKHEYYLKQRKVGLV